MAMNPDTALTAAKLVFSGRGIGAAFLDFVADRAGRLGLQGRGAVSSHATEATVLVSGPSALVDMLEVACMLGPIDCLVEEVSRESIRFVPDSAGFHLDRTVPDRAAN